MKHIHLFQLEGGFSRYSNSFWTGTTNQMQLDRDWSRDHEKKAKGIHSYTESISLDVGY
jgi:hypothetical protein